MSRLSGRRVVLGICGSIAAYKSVEVCRLLGRAGASVVPVLTPAAERFLGAATLTSLAAEPARTSLWAGPEPVPHTALGRSADVVVVAPATAHLLAAYAAGLADGLLTATLLATAAPVVVAPAMHTEMWEHPATRANVELLLSRGVVVVEPGTGPLAAGDEGTGRLAEPAVIVEAVEGVLAPPDLAGRIVVITSGGTREPIDPIRFVGNRSSGRQGEAIAAEARARGAEVTLVTAADRPAPAGVEVVRVGTAAEMEAAVLARSAADVVVLAAAVADFRPKASSDEKLRKEDGVPELLLEPTPDIAAEVGRRRRRGQVLVGFAAETATDPDELAQRGAAKLRRKGLDLVVANDLRSFDSPDTSAVLVFADGSVEETPVVSKRALATRIVDAVVRRLGTAPPNRGDA